MKYLLIILTSIGITNCAFNFELPAQKSILEKQIIGVYPEFDEEEEVKAVLRGGLTLQTYTNLPKLSALKFHRLIIRESADRGLLGFLSNGSVKIRPYDAIPDYLKEPEYLARLSLSVDEYNAAMSSMASGHTDKLLITPTDNDWRILADGTWQRGEEI